MGLVVGIDLGTQSCKAVVCDGSLRVQGRGRVAYAPSYPQPGHAEQDPRLWVEALAPAIAQALAEAGRASEDVGALAITGQLDGLVAVDAAGDALGPCMIWMDRRAQDALPELDAAWFLQVTGQVADGSHLAAKARWWDRHHPARAAAFHQPVSFVVEQLGGERVFDPSLASTTMLWDLDAAAWSPELLAAFELDAARLPRVAPATDVAGRLTERGAERTGLRRGTIVAVGTGDDFASPLGAGLAAGELACVLGTAEVAGVRAAAARRDPQRLVETHAYPAGGFFVENPGWLSGGAVAWLGGLLGLDAAAIDEAASQAPAGAGGVAFLPALAGAMTPVWDASARGAFVGLTAAHGVPHLCRALHEGCAHALRDVADRLRELDLAPAAIRLLGGGARSRTAARARADIAGLPVLLPADGDETPRGAAMLAAVAAGRFPDLTAAAAALPPPRARLEPDPSTRALHDAAHARQRALYHALATLPCATVPR